MSRRANGGSPVLDEMWHPVPGGHADAAVAACAACEELIAGVEGEWPGGEADRALERLRARVDALLGRGADDGGFGEVPALEVDCLGVTGISAGGVAITPPRRSRLVLQYLVAHGGGPVARETLLAAFWPGSGPSAARNSLNVAVTLLRRALRPAYGDRPVIVFGDGGYRVHPDVPLRVDRDRFARLAAEGAALRRAGDHAAAVRQLGEAVALHRGPLFADEPYEEWIVTMRRDVEAVRLAALVDLGEGLAALGDLDGSVRALRAVVAAEPVREDVHRALMRRFVAQGRPGLALRQFDECAAALRRRLGVGPSPETWGVRERIARRPVVVRAVAGAGA